MSTLLHELSVLISIIPTMAFNFLKILCQTPLVGSLLTLLALASEPSSLGEKGVMDIEVKLAEDKLRRGSSCCAAIIISLQKGWHVNASIPSSPDLVGTSVVLEGGSGVRLDSVRYPPPVERRFKFAEEAVEVYEGTIVIAGRLYVAPAAKPGRRTLRLSITYQACSDNVCLPPVSRQVDVPVEIVPKNRQVHRINTELFNDCTDTLSSPPK